ncbi:tannase/feruloyl esterase family alpha/beta hydrolase [Streptomyces sp. 8L]|uniref:tannase/feruloyl esterase family alpha/beta hydrolase n=1 Tax=Streptomyces sp. 8L TaxID=2877242 RepID=UPI001CD4305E|nr:tannase/feruloyl esterase family alpha/beta hydrolase [Streptomyces sp. 8L]MCA1217354.1 tannase/feruloyl esterase family alpha/beta hydrolase [Streptomyces sp. 8L]
MKRVLTVLAAGVPLVAAVCLPTASAEPRPSAGAPPACTAPAVQAPPGTEVVSAAADSRAGGTIHGAGYLGGEVPDVPAFCEVTFTLTHPGDGDHATVRTWLPLTAWNGRFQAVGGTAFSAGDNGVGLGAAVKNGYAATTTDAGVGDVLDTGWVLNGKGQVNTALLKNFASRSQHEAAILGKAVVNSFYGKRAAFSYFTGCSTGGREGYMEAERYPDDYDGILADAPAINWDKYVVATLWPQVVMNNERTYPTDCEFKAFTDAAVTACDKLDGLKDGLVDDVSRCDFDPRRLIGTKVTCDGGKLTITAADAEVVRKIWDGPRTASGRKLWSGVPIGADLSGLAGSTTDTDGTTKGVPFQVPAAWTQLFLKKDPSFDLSTITYRDFTTLFEQSEAEYGKIIGTGDPDLSAFRKSGGKLITWQGSADQYIPTQGTVRYRTRVERETGGSSRTDGFYRLFLAPNTAHCGLDGLDGSADGLAALTGWVEHGKAPATLPAVLINAGGERVERDLCAYPGVSRYKGEGDPALASSFRCVLPPGH